MKLVTRALKVQNKMKVAISLFFLKAALAMASTSDAPWVGMLDKIMKVLVGPTARLLSIFALVVVGFVFMSGNTKEGGKMGLNIAVGVSIIFAAATWGPKFFGYSGSILM
ncbi:TrbC/VirB2 family protein [Fusobacterium necrophorum]|uniref:TrbC/VirB2 family protein n=1 Tax=Fusobacterium TaxID=848 RepID=UPI00254A63AC|nr:TrbC/VirB2 family protein [Fusobacterium necrophorum]MDK4494997.1 TrbC/VirB2 family protein [Fusobacterium necrophorum]